MISGDSVRVNYRAEERQGYENLPQLPLPTFALVLCKNNEDLDSEISSNHGEQDHSLACAERSAYQFYVYV